MPPTRLTRITPEVIVYSEDALAEVISNDWVKSDAMRGHNHFSYFREYLGAEKDGLNAQTMVVEDLYISNSYLADYTNYYAQCFAEYERYCKRVHFFGAQFNQEALLAALAVEKHPIWESYLGYIVVKPLPAPIGATLLRPYTSSQQKQRRYPVQRPYTVNLLGKKLVVETLIFQQQDTNVSACATTALWMAFHKTAFLFQTALPSPYHITESAGNLFNHSGRTFPNRGLDPFQIMTAIQAIGLVSELRNNYRHPGDDGVGPAEATKQLWEAKAFIYAYLRMGLPVLLFIKFDHEGGHLIAATGYREPAIDYAYTTGPALALVSDGIEQMYAHDDGIGPYSRLGFDDATGLLETSWPVEGDWNNHEKAWLFTVAVPIVSEIRIQYEQVYEQAVSFDGLLKVFRDLIYPGEQAPLVWDIYLAFSNAYKSDLLQNQSDNPSQQQRVTSRLLPKYVWVARALYKGKAFFEMVFDATDLHTGFYCILTNTYSPLRDELREALQQPGFSDVLAQSFRFDSRYLRLLLDDLDLPQMHQS
jgi:hypothetical protein